MKRVKKRREEYNKINNTIIRMFKLPICYAILTINCTEASPIAFRFRNGCLVVKNRGSEEFCFLLMQRNKLITLEL